MNTLITDSETIQVPFITKSQEEFPVDFDSLKKLMQYRQALDEKMISMAPRNQGTKAILLSESRKVTRFINNYNAEL